MLYISVALILFVVIVDQLTKYAVLTAIGAGGKPLTVIEGFFYIVCHRNSGAAWGILKDAGVFFLAVIPILVVVMAVFLVKTRDPLLRIALSFVIGGAIGNYIDRIFAGGVVDFLDFYIFGYNFPTFNAADSSIVLGSALLVFFSIRYKPQNGDAT